MNKVLKKIVSATLALGCIVGCAATFTGCTTSHPEAKITIEFNGKTYALEYKMYRKITPTTVNHFITLAENGYFDGLCVHDYTGTRMYTGGYTYDETKDDLIVYKPYFETVAAYKSFSHSVWKDDSQENPTYTLYGEFSKNNFRVQNGSLKDGFGSLTMYYEDKGTCEDFVSVKRSDGNKYSSKEYKYNSATSLFYINLSTSSSTNSQYCTFAELDGDSKETLESLQNAIDEYIETTFGTEEGASSEFIESVTVDVCEDDPYVGDSALVATYEVPVEPIVIKSVKITKY